MTTIKIRMVVEKTTKGAIKYAELSEKGVCLTPMDPGAKIGTLYIRKSAFNGAVPERITIEVNDDV